MRAPHERDNAATGIGNHTLQAAELVRDRIVAVRRVLAAGGRAYHRAVAGFVLPDAASQGGAPSSSAAFVRCPFPEHILMVAVVKRIGRKVATVIIGAIRAVLAVPLVLLAVPLAGVATTLTGERRRHEEAWAPMRGLNADGLTPFQVLCERRLVGATAAVGVSLADRKVKPTTYRGQPQRQLWIEWSIEGTPLTVGVYPDGAGIWGPDIDDRFEEWDALTPGELIDVVCENTIRRAMACRKGR